MIAMFTARLLLRSPSWRRLSWRCRRPGPPRRRNSRLCSAPSYERQQKRINSWTVGLAGLIEGAPLRPAMEMAHVVDDGTNLLVLPTVRLGMTGRGSMYAAPIWRLSTPASARCLRRPNDWNVSRNSPTTSRHRRPQRFHRARTSAGHQSYGRAFPASFSPAFRGGSPSSANTSDRIVRRERERDKCLP